MEVRAARQTTSTSKQVTSVRGHRSPAGIAQFARAYGVHDRITVRWALHQSKQQSLDALRYFSITPAEGAGRISKVATELEWLDGALDELVGELDDQLESDGW